MTGLKIEKYQFKGSLVLIEAQLLQEQNAENKLAVVLPGAGYSVKQPLLYYATEVLLKHRYRVLAIDTVYGEVADWTKLTSEQEARKVVEDDAVEMFREIPNRLGAQPHLVLGRSLGTYAIACAIEHKVLTPQQIVWQTPALGGKWSIMKGCGIRSLGILGTSDHYYDKAKSHMPDESIIVEGADHGMEIAGDPIRSIEILGQVTRAFDEWLTGQ